MLHPGSPADREQGLKNIAETINQIYAEQDFTVPFSRIERRAGNTLPVSIEEMATIYELCSEKKKKVKFTLDTCHLHASGYNLSTKILFIIIFERI